MERPTCETCPYWFWEKGGYSRVEEAVDSGDQSECRRRAPHADQEKNGTDRAIRRTNLMSCDHVLWPMTNGLDWCGDHPMYPDYLNHKQKAIFSITSESEDVVPEI